jgi:hypothetical protein
MDEDEDLIRNSLEIIRNEKRASTSLLQRRLRLGYTRAERILNILEQRGFVGPGEGAKPRQILMDLKSVAATEPPDQPAEKSEAASEEERQEMSAGYFLWRDEKQDGPFTLKDILRLFRRMDHGVYSGDSLYRREGMRNWRPLRFFAHFEFGDPPETRIAQIREVGIKHIQWLTAGRDDECAACKELNEKIFSIDAAPPMPPVNCRCELYCACLFIAVKSPKKL